MFARNTRFIEAKKDGNEIKSYCLYDFVGLSTDAKPTSGVCEGSTFFEENTSKLYMMKADSTWVQILA